MTHPITPPPELVGEWLCDDGYPWDPSENATITITTNRLKNVATQAARWGSDQELEACCEWLADDHTPVLGQRLRDGRRPKPPSLKAQALDQLSCIQIDLTRYGMGISVETIRRALQALPDD